MAEASVRRTRSAFVAIPVGDRLTGMIIRCSGEFTLCVDGDGVSFSQSRLDRMDGSFRFRERVWKRLLGLLISELLLLWARKHVESSKTFKLFDIDDSFEGLRSATSLVSLPPKFSILYSRLRVCTLQPCPKDSPQVQPQSCIVPYPSESSFLRVFRLHLHQKYKWHGPSESGRRTDRF